MVMKTLMFQELKSSIWNNVDAMQLIELLLPKPDSQFDILKHNKKLSESMFWDGSLTKPNTMTEESAEFRVATWLNKISNLFGQLHKSDSTLINPPRLWNSDACQRPLPAKTKQKPDIILTGGYGRHSEMTWGWEDVQIFIEVTSKKLPKGTLSAEMRSTLYSKAYMIFQAQQDRCFVLALTIWKTQLYVSLLDHAGVVHSSPIDMVECPDVVLHVLMGIVFATPTMIGYDPSITKVDGETVVHCNKHQYTVIDTLFAHHIIRGRATICWHARRDGQDYVIKDSWPNIKRTQSESEFLHEAAKLGISGVPVLIDHEDVNGIADGTDTQWAFSSNNNKLKKMREEIDSHVHRRLVLQPPGVPLAYFSSKSELISVLIDIIIGT